MNCKCGLNLYVVMTDGKAFEYVRLGPGCSDAVKRAELRGWRRADRCEACGTIYDRR